MGIYSGELIHGVISHLSVLVGLFSGVLIHGGAYFRGFTVYNNESTLWWHAPNSILKVTYTNVYFFITCLFIERQCHLKVLKKGTKNDKVTPISHRNVNCHPKVGKSSKNGHHKALLGNYIYISYLIFKYLSSSIFVEKFVHIANLSLTRFIINKKRVLHQCSLLRYFPNISEVLFYESWYSQWHVR
jgi:hypothetical protein